MFPICTILRAKAVLPGMKFNTDSMYTRYILCGTVGDIFADDAMYHKNCMSSFITQFQKRHEILNLKDDDQDESIGNAFECIV